MAAPCVLGNVIAEKHLLEKYGEPCPEAMVESALYHVGLLEEHDFRAYKSASASDVL